MFLLKILFHHLYVELNLHFDPIDVANTINTYYDSIEDWWLEPHRQKALQSFKTNLCNQSSTAYKDWLNEIMNN